jgi:hypothetical protein
MEKQSRKHVVLKVDAVFAVGLLLFIVQFGARSLWDMLFFFTMPFMTWKGFVRDGVLVVWYGLAVLMLVSVGVSIWSRRLLWISYILIGAYWLWTYVLMTLSF